MVRDTVRQCLADYDKDLEAWNESRARGENGRGTSDNDEYYNKYREYKCPQGEFRRIHDVAYMSLYVLANIGRLDANLLAEWIQKEKPRLYHCPDMDVWLIDAYFSQDGVAEDSEPAKKHSALTQGLQLAGRRTRQSKWDQPWDIHAFLPRAKGVDFADIETVEMLGIPAELPPNLDEKTKQHIIDNFLSFAGQSKWSD
ncbi:MAG: hypothetical protein ACYTBJ_05905 [Planctomycetota bacterium]